MSCSINRDDIRQGIKDDVAKSLDTSKLFNRTSPIEYTFSPIDTSSPYKEIVAFINRSYEEDVIQEAEDAYSINPPDTLIDTYERKYNGKDSKLYGFSEKNKITPKQPDITSQTWKDLVGKIGTAKAYDEYVRNGYVIPDPSGFNDTFKGVNATMKIIAALEKSPRTAYPSNQIEGFYNDLRKYGAPEQQINLLKAYIAEHNIQEINKTELIAGLLAEMSYTVEINTATDRISSLGTQRDSKDFILDGIKYNSYRHPYEDGIMYRKEDKETTQEIYEEAIKLYRKEYDDNIKVRHTQHYSNMTVPGGTNYTENEIATPAITPSIKGHAQFATYKGIGWFRSDEQVTFDSGVSDKEEAYYNPDTDELTINDSGRIIKGGKTRRILEVQSDLFQKGRNKTDLVLYKLRKDLSEQELTTNNSDNQFLQLLNKDSNWVTFFIKSIIQDSARKGYEKVLFPSGDTASKVEGHTTLEEFKKQKEDRIKELENSKVVETKWDNGKQAFKIANKEEKPIIENLYSPSSGDRFNTKEEASEKINIEINQLKQELERVNGPEGFGALKPIYNFYETTVGNILKKQGYNPVTVTDEYGNTWYEVNIKDTEYANQRILYGAKDVREVNMNYDLAPVLEEAGLTETSTPQDFINENMQEYSEQFKNARKANPTFTIEFGEEESGFDSKANKIVINLMELNNKVAKRANIPLKQVISIFILHELGHAVTAYGFQKGRNSERIQELMNIAIAHDKTNPFEDVLRQGFKKEDGVSYAFKNIDEFAAEAYANPYFQAWLRQIPSTENRSLLQEIWDTILEFLGLAEKPLLYDDVIDYINSERIQEDNLEGSEHPSENWNMQMVYRGNPKTYFQAAFDLFTTPAITDEVHDTIINKFPAAVIKIKKQLNYETDKDKIKKLQSLLDAYNDVKENEQVISVSINMILQAGSIARDMEQQLIEIPKLDDDAKKLTLAYSLLKNVEAIEFMEPLAQDILNIIKREGETAVIRPFMNQLNGIIATVNSVKRTYVKVAQPLILKRLTEFIGETETEKEILQDIARLKEQYKDTQDGVTKEILRRRIALKEEEAKLVPSKANLELIFAGQYRDSSMGQLLFEAGMMNDHPIPVSIMKILRENNIAVSHYMLGIQNEAQREQDVLRKDLGYGNIRSTDDFYKPIINFVSRANTIMEDEEGNIILENGKPKFEYTIQKMLLSSYSPDYIRDASEKKAAIDYYHQKLFDADRKNDFEAIAVYRDKLNEAYKDRRNFFRENSENKFTEEVLQMYDLLEKEIKKDDGTITTFAKERGYIFEDIQQAEQRREEEINIETLSLLQEEIKGLYIKQNQLKSKYDPDTGKEKTGLEKELSDIANQYAELKTKYGKYELTERGQAMFEKEKLSLDNKLNGGFISKDEYERRLGEITVTELSEEYYGIVNYYLGRIDDVSKKLAGLPEFEKVFKGVNSESIRDGYAKIRDLVRGFRDNEMTIDGQLFSKVRPLLVKEIQKIQQEVEDLKGIAEKLRGLSIEETIRARELRGKQRVGNITQEEDEELTALKEKTKNSDRAYLKYKTLIDEYTKLLKQFSKLNDSSNSQYYIDELEHQKAILLPQEVNDVKAQIDVLNSLEQGKYIKNKNGVWEEVLERDGNFIKVTPIEMSGFATVEEALANKIAREHIETKVKETEWWENNHFQKYVWTKKGYQKVESPIYIWVKNEPRNKEYLIEGQPSIKFKAYSVNAEHHNPNFGFINDNIPVPKAGKYVNNEYFRMINSSDPKDRAYFKYLEYARKSFRRAQEFIPAERRLGDILPSFIKTADELSVERTNAVAQRSMQMLQEQFALGFAADDTLDEQSVTHGSTTDFFAKNRVLPIRFSGRMDHTRQSSDIAAMMLSYELAAAEYNQQLEDQPMLEAIRIAVEELPVQQSKSMASKISVPNLIASIKSAVSSQTVTKKVTSQKKTDKSNLSKTVDHMLSTYLYGETKTSANITVGGMDFDLNKASAGLKKLSSLSIFALNAFVAVKNTVSAVIQGNINANIGKGFFTKAQYNKAHIEAMGHVKDFLADYRKFGNKTKIGQELDYFQVLQGASYNEFGQKTAWTALKNTESFITGLKNSSEFELQVAQYLAMSKANPVKLADGTWVEMRKAFEINEKGDLVPVAGAELTTKQINSFIFKLNYVNRVINGAYRAEEKNMIQKNILGDLAFYLNGYVVPLMVNRFGKTRYSAEADMITRGYIRQLFSFMGDLIRYRTDINKQWSVMSADEKHRVLRGTKELGAIIGMAILVMALGGNDDKKELKQSEAISNWALSIALAVKAETETFVPIPGMGLNDMARKMNSPFAAVRQVSNLIKALQNLTLYVGDKVGIDAPEAYYKSSSIKDGFHDKGDPKFVANFLKLVGWSGIAFDPVEKALQQKNIQTLR